MADPPLSYRFSQFGEDNFILDFFENIQPRHKYFCDVGAFDGDLFSNTRALGLKGRGWRGILVEPHPTPFAKLRELYKDQDMILTQAVVGRPEVHGRKVEFYTPAGDYGMIMLSSCLESEKERWPQVKEWTKIEVPLLTLKEVLESGKEPVEFLSIDAEGMDVEVIESAGWNERSSFPRLVMVEHNENRHRALDRLDGLLCPFGYVRVYTRAVNAAWAMISRFAHDK